MCYDDMEPIGPGRASDDRAAFRYGQYRNNLSTMTVWLGHGKGGFVPRPMQVFGMAPQV
jgi:hypothetical protein